MYYTNLKRFTTGVLFLVLMFSFKVSAQKQTMSKDSLPLYGTQHINADYFKENYQFNNLALYLDNINEFVTYQSETTGNFQLPDNYIFSVNGNSHKWNKYYLNGFRIDSRLFAGSTFYQPDIFNHALELNYYTSELSFTQNTNIENSVSVGYNVGGLGGISPFTEEQVNLFHLTASQRLYPPSLSRYNPLVYRNKMLGSGTLSLNYAIPVGDQNYSQQLYVDFGTRMQDNFDEEGISGYYPEDFYKIQLNGQLPLKPNKAFDAVNYLFHIANRTNLYSESYFAQNESAKNNSLGISVYGTKHHQTYNYTTGFTFNTDKITHNDLNFSRNIIDQDGEAFEPWYPNSVTSEFSHAVKFEKTINEFLSLTFDGYNSLLHFAPTQNNFYNTVYSRNIDEPYIPLYVYNWTANEFNAGLLENTLSLKGIKALSKQVTLRANADLTFDAMLLSGKSMIRPNWQAQLGFYYKPSRLFSMEVNVSRYRVAFNVDDIKYFSDDYLNGDIYYWDDSNNDESYTANEKRDYFTSTGGKYHTAVSGLKQPSYFTLDIPLYFTFRNFRFSIINTYRKYNNNWITRFDKSAEEYGQYVPVGDKSIFFLNNGTVNYIIDDNLGSIMETNTFTNFLTNSPFYLANTLKLDYTGKKFFGSISLISNVMGGISTLGNGPLHNNLGVYSESSANPNINYKLIGRLDQERAYVIHILASYKLNDHFSFSASGKFKDGQPFSSFDTKVLTDASGNNQIAVWNDRTKGINPFNYDFGSREDAFFNIDVRANYKGFIGKKSFELQLMCYNIYDYGTELTEYIFLPLGTSRRAMSLNIPRGLLFTATYNL